MHLHPVRQPGLLLLPCCQGVPPPAQVVSSLWSEPCTTPRPQSIGYIGVMAEGLIIAIHFRQTDGSERVKAIWSHAVMQLRAAVLVIIGFGVIYRNKVRVPGRSGQHMGTRGL